MNAIKEGFDAEVDVWYNDNQWCLGHDKPDHKVEFNFFTSEMWLHCKNLQAVEKLKGTNLNWFWHETDKIAQTSAGHIWCYPNVHVDNSIMVILGLPHETPRNLKGVCTDHAISWREFSS